MNISKAIPIEDEEFFDGTMDPPNSVTIAAMLEAERIANDPSVKGYTDVDEFLADLKK